MFSLCPNHKPLKYCDHSYLQLTLGNLYCKPMILNGWLLIGVSPELHRELSCTDRTMLIFHFWRFQVIQHSEKFLQICSKEPSFMFFHLLPVLIPQDIYNCWHACSSRAKMRLSVSKHDWSLFTTLLRVWPAALNIICRSSVLPLPQMWLSEASRLSKSRSSNKSKTRLTKDNCISTHFFKKET